MYSSLKCTIFLATYSSAVASLVQEDDAGRGVLGVNSFWHRPVAGRMSRCRFIRHCCPTVDRSIGSRHSLLAAPSGQGVTRGEGVVGGVVRNDTMSSGFKLTF